MKAIKNTEQLLERIKTIMEKEFLPTGYYYVDKLTRRGQTSLVIHILYDDPEAINHYPKERGQ